MFSSNVVYKLKIKTFELHILDINVSYLSSWTKSNYEFVHIYMFKMKVTPQPLLKLVEVQLTFKSSILKSTDNKNFLLFPSGKNDITFQIIPVRNLELITSHKPRTTQRSVFNYELNLIMNWINIQERSNKIFQLTSSSVLRSWTHKKTDMGYTNKFTSMIFSLRYLATLPTTQRTLLILSD